MIQVPWESWQNQDVVGMAEKAKEKASEIIAIHYPLHPNSPMWSGFPAGPYSEGLSLVAGEKTACAPSRKTQLDKAGAG